MLQGLFTPDMTMDMHESESPLFVMQLASARCGHSACAIGAGAVCIMGGVDMGAPALLDDSLVIAWRKFSVHTPRAEYVRMYVYV
jgi:hypothetical protein